MKRILFLLSIFLFAGFIFTALAQELRVITLDKDDGLLANPSRITLSPGDTLQFKSIDGDFAIYIQDAISFLRIKDVDLKIRVNSALNPESQMYIVKKVESDIDETYSIYCLTTNSWPDSPPRIIVLTY